MLRDDVKPFGLDQLQTGYTRRAGRSGVESRVPIKCKRNLEINESLLNSALDVLARDITTGRYLGFEFLIASFKLIRDLVRGGGIAVLTSA